MRFRRLSFIAGWAAVVLLAWAGFATFGTSGQRGQLADDGTVRLGHQSGAYAGLAFAVLGAPTPTVSGLPETETASQLPDTSADTGEAVTDPPTAPGTIAPPDDGWLSQVEVRTLVSRYFAAEDVNRAVRVAWCESRFDPEAVNLRTAAVGLFQHLPRYWPERAANAGFPGADPTDPEASTAAAAWEVYQGAGWEVFACRD